MCERLDIENQIYFLDAEQELDSRSHCSGNLNFMFFFSGYHQSIKRHIFMFKPYILTTINIFVENETKDVYKETPKICSSLLFPLNVTYEFFL